jgi:hypothetical protein
LYDPPGAGVVPELPDLQRDRGYQWDDTTYSRNFLNGFLP